MGREVSHDDLAALSIRFRARPATGALSVFSDDREIRRDLAAIFRDVVLAADGAIEDMPMLEFDLRHSSRRPFLPSSSASGSRASSVSTFSTLKGGLPFASAKPTTRRGIVNRPGN